MDKQGYKEIVEALDLERSQSKFTVFPPFPEKPVEFVAITRRNMGSSGKASLLNKLGGAGLLSRGGSTDKDKVVALQPVDFSDHGIVFQDMNYEPLLPLVD